MVRSSSQTSEAPKPVADDIRHCRRKHWCSHQAVPAPVSQPAQQDTVPSLPASTRYVDFLRQAPRYVLRASLVSLSWVAWLLQTFISVVWFIFPPRQALI
jgi:hypothetical protein